MSKSFSLTILLGNVGKKPEIKNVGGTSVVEFSLATSKRWKDKSSGEFKEKTEWHKCKAWRESAENIFKYVEAGDRIQIMGHNETRVWGEGESKRYITEVLVDEFILLGGTKGKSGSYPQNSSQEELPVIQVNEIGPTVDDLPF